MRILSLLFVSLLIDAGPSARAEHSSSEKLLKQFQEKEERTTSAVGPIQSLEELNEAIAQAKKKGQVFQILVWSPSSEDSKKFKTEFEKKASRFSPEMKFYSLNASLAKGFGKDFPLPKAPTVLMNRFDKDQKLELWEPYVEEQAAVGQTIKQKRRLATSGEYEALLEGQRYLLEKLKASSPSK